MTKPRKRNRLIYGVGINDANYAIGGSTGGINWKCPYYQRWCDMLKRAYSSTYHKNHPSYKGVTVCDEWSLFSNFKEWVISQGIHNWQEYELDKDFLSEEEKIYSPETCIFISHNLNIFIADSKRARGKQPIGVSTKGRKFRASCSNPFSEKRPNQEYLGTFSTPEEAHEAWRQKKEEYANLLAEEAVDPRVAAKLREMYKKKE